MLSGTTRIITEDTITHVIADMSKDDGDKNMERFQVCCLYCPDLNVISLWIVQILPGTVYLT